MNKIIFNYENQDLEIQCKPEDQMKKIFQNFGQKIGVNFKDLFFNYNGNIINEDLKLEQIENSIDKERRIMNVLVYNKDQSKKKSNFQISKEIICPKCGDNTCLSIQNYKLSLSGCINGHNVSNISFNDFFKTQNIDMTKIKCDICKNRNRGDTFDNKFYYCLSCKSNLCVLCNSIHDETHKIIKYDQKNCYCQKHYSNYIKYCNQCKKNICIQCEKEHKTHNTLYFGDILIDKENFLNEINSLREVLNKFQNDINSIINLFINFSENINTYFKIASIIIKNYNFENLNFLELKNITAFSEYNKIIIKDLNRFINEEDINKKFEYLNGYIQNKNNNNNNKMNEIIIENMIEKSSLNFNSEVTTLIQLNNKKDIAVCFSNGYLGIFDLKL